MQIRCSITQVLIVE